MARITGRLCAALVACTLAALTAWSAPSLASASARPSPLEVKGTHFCITVEGGVVLSGNAVILEACDGGVAQVFLLRGTSIIYARTLGAAIVLCVGNERALGKAVLLNCHSHNAQVKFVGLRGGARGFRLTGGFVSAPAVGQVRVRNITHPGGRETFVTARP
jgi:hypothetical protein